MSLAFTGQGRYTDYDSGYQLYVRRVRTKQPVDRSVYRKVVQEYCKSLAEKLERDGFVDLPAGLGTISAAVIRRKPKYRNGKFIGIGKWDRENKRYDGSLKTFGLVFLPRKRKKQNLRSYGFVGNRRLFQRMKDIYEGYDRSWTPIDFNDEMI